MNKRFIFSIAIFAAVVAGGHEARAAAAEACAAIPQNYNGQAVCVSSYDTCIQNRPGDAGGCTSAARQLGQSTYNNGACGAQGGTNCTDTPTAPLDYINTVRPALAPATTGTASPTGGGRANPDGTLPYTPLEPLPGVPSGSNTNFAQLLNGLFKLFITIGGLLAVAALVVGGITYMVSDVVDRKHDAKNRMYAAVWGLLLLLASYLILNTINPQLVNFSGSLTPAPRGATIQHGATGAWDSPAQQNSQEISCKSQGPSCALQANPNGSATCTCGA